MGQIISGTTSGHATSTTQGNGHPAATIKSYAPATGELLGEIAVTPPEKARDAIARARRAQQAWAALPIEERCDRVLRYRDALVDRADEVIELLSRETGKPKLESLLHEVLVAADIATFFAKAAPKMLAPRELSLHLAKHRRSFVHQTPRGVVLVISPWNFPLLMPLRDAIMALVAGNAVVIKPSEVTPLIALKAKELWDSTGLPEDLFQVCPGYGPTGAALIDAMPDFVILTGSVATGRRVAAACGERLIPCVMELGGKAPLIACADADVDRTARAIVWGGFANAGQICLSVERVYAHREVYDKLVDEVAELTRKLRQGDPAKADVDVGAIIFPHQIDVAEKHIADALGKGAALKTGGKRVPGPGQFFEPTVLADCNHSMTVMTQEIFGPIVPMMRVSTEEEAVRLSNELPLGLNAYVFTADREHGRQLAERIDAGNVLVNDVLANGAVPEAPFGGVKQSGFGRTLGEEGLREMCTPRHISSDRFALKNDPLWFPYTDARYGWFRKSLRVMYSSGGLLKKISDLF